MTIHRTPFRRAVALSAAALALVAIAGCSSSDSEGTTTTTEAATTTTSGSAAESAATKRFDEGIQQQLADVGCYTGAIDGILGPESDAAILAFQGAEGLTTDGELGPQTESALSTAAEAGDKVCTGDTTTTTAADTTTTTAASGGEAPCTATAIAAALPSGTQITSYVCSEGYAAGSESSGTQFILQSTDGAWATLPSDPCGAASAGLPAVILEDGCPA